MKSLLYLITILTGVSVSGQVITVTAVNSGNWTTASNWSPSGTPGTTGAAGATYVVVIPNSKSIDVNSSVYSPTLPTLTIQVSGILNFHPSGKLDLSSASRIQIFSTGSIVPQNNASSQIITIGGVAKYNGGTDGTVSGPAFASAASGTAGGAPGSGFFIGSLPVHLTSFTGTLESRSVRLNWTTAEESNTDHFELEKSIDEGENWVGFYQQKTNNQPSTYTAVDNILSANTILYRLKTVDNDRRFTYSATVRIRKDKAASLFISPNPATSVIHISVGQPLTQKTTVQISNAAGQRVRQVDFPNGSNLLQIPVQNLPKGLYTVLVLTVAGLLDSQLVSIQ